MSVPFCVCYVDICVEQMLIVETVSVYNTGGIVVDVLCKQ